MCLLKHSVLCTFSQGRWNTEQNVLMLLVLKKILDCILLWAVTITDTCSLSFLTKVYCMYIVQQPAPPVLKYMLCVKLFTYHSDISHTACLLWTLPAPLRPSSKVTDLVNSLFFLFTHASFIATCKDHTPVFACFVMFNTFELKSMLQATLSPADIARVLRCFHSLFEQLVSRTWGLLLYGSFF